MDDAALGAVEWRNWWVLVDRRWEGADSGAVPPSTVIVGGWLLDANGDPGPFQPNPDYVPIDEASPTDPVDAVLRRVADGHDVGSEVIPTVRDAVVEIACDNHNRPLIGLAPDKISCVAVVTAAVHKHRIDAARWWPVVGSRLPDIVPAGVDILLNPGSPAQFRLLTEALGSRG